MADSEFKFQDNTMKVLAAMDNKILAKLEERAAEVESRTKRNSRVGSPGAQTKNSWGHKVFKNNDECIAVIGSDNENAIWEEFGTGEHALKGNGRKGAWYVPVEKVVGKKKPTYNGKVIIVHGKNGQDYYKTNGKKPSRAFWKAYTSLKNKIINHIQNSLKGL